MKRHLDLGLVFLAIFLVAVITAMAFAAGYISHNGYTQFQYNLFVEAYTILEKNGLKPMPSAKTTEYEMIRGLVKAYDDPYTVFVEPVQHEIETDQLEGKFGGIGADIQRDSDGNVRIYPYFNAPAADAGIPNGAVLLAVEQLIITPETPVEEIVTALRGEVSSKVEVTYAAAPGGNPTRVRLERREFAIPSVTWHMVPERADLGLVKVTTMAATTASEMTAAIDDLTKQGATTLILDFRGNGGGLVEAGVEVVELFEYDNTPIITLAYPDRPDEIKNARGTGLFPDIPLYIFMDNNTASSAEIVVGALQTAKRAILIGVPSFGKDTIQLVFDLQDGSSIHVSAARWFFPDNPAFGAGAGLQPDIPLPPDQLSDETYLRAVLESMK